MAPGATSAALAAVKRERAANGGAGAGSVGGGRDLGLPGGLTGSGPKGKTARDSKSQENTGSSSRKRSVSSDSDVEIIEQDEHAPEEICISDSESDDASVGDDSDDCGSDNSEWEELGSSTKGQAKIKVGKVTIEAFCVDVDEEVHGGSGSVKDELSRGDDAVQDSGAGAANEEVRLKIRKMLQLGLHPDTPDNEAQQALKNANRFLTRYNLQQVDILKEAEDEGNESTLAGGMKVVKLRCKGANRSTVNNAAWISRLGALVSNCFDCCCYSQHVRDGLHFVFYGIVTNAECAGYAFAAAFNRISVMTANYCGDGRARAPRRSAWGGGGARRRRRTRCAQTTETGWWRGCGRRCWRRRPRASGPRGGGRSAGALRWT